MNTLNLSRTDETIAVEDLLRSSFPHAPASHMPRVYRYNLASIRVRVVDASFRGKSRSQREEIVYPILEQLPEATQDDITILLLLTPEEAGNSLMNLEFENPTPTRLPMHEAEAVA